MAKGRQPVLETRCVGMRPHFSGHVLAPPEYVYETMEPEMPRVLGLPYGTASLIATLCAGLGVIELFAPTVLPQPVSLVLACVGLAGVLYCRRRFDAACSRRM